MGRLCFFVSLFILGSLGVKFDENQKASHDDLAAFIDFVKTYNRSYANQEEFQNRFHIFLQNREFINNHNQQNLSYTVAINNFADMTNDEYLSMYLTKPINTTINPNGMFNISDPQKLSLNLPVDWSWRDVGAVTEPKSSGICGCSWAFATTGAVESCHFLNTGTLPYLSEQQLLDCSFTFGTQGCFGGFPDNAFNFIIANNGIESETAYPYEQFPGACHPNPAACTSTISAWQEIPSRDGPALHIALASQPITVVIDGNAPGFRFYSSGVFHSPECNPGALSLSMLATGWGIEDNVPYWELKNCWGTAWGRQGYARMLRVPEDKCGVTTLPTYPVGCGNC